MKKIIIAIAVLGAFLLAACEDGGSEAAKQDEEVSEEILADLQKAHPVPKFDRSQLRQNLVEIISAQADTTQTTTFFFNYGVTDPVFECPSIGFPIPATSQLTSPEQTESRRDRGMVAVPQVEPTGIYTGDTAATYVICIDANGDAFAHYAEEFVSSVAAPATWDTETKRITLIGSPSFDFSGNDE